MITRLAFVTGDPAGIGGELMATALADPALPKDARIIIIGDRRVLAPARKCAACPSTCRWSTASRRRLRAMLP